MHCWLSRGSCRHQLGPDLSFDGARKRKGKQSAAEDGPGQRIANRQYGEAPFNHETHSAKNYSIDGKSVIACVECLTPISRQLASNAVETSERALALTTALLATADANRVKSCRACHCKRATIALKCRPSPMRESPRPPSANEVAYPMNCNVVMTSRSPRDRR